MPNARSGRLLVLVVLLTANAASADNRDRAREKFKQASQHFDLGEYKDALAAFKDAYREYEDPSFLFNIGQCYRQLGDKEQAIRFYRTYLSKVPDAPNRDDVRSTIASLEKAVAEEHAARSGPPTGTLSPTGATPTPAEGAAPASGAPGATTPAVSAAASPAAANERTPVYKKWWLWTIVGVVVVGAAVGTGVGVAAAHPSHPTATTDFGTLAF